MSRGAPAGGAGRRGFDAVSRSDVLVVGAGAAGLTAALGCAPLSVTVLTKARLGSGAASAWAQGGVASALGEDDNPALHAADTIAAGAGLNDRAMVELLTGEGPQRVRSLLALGAHFDLAADGRLALGREGAHSRRRIVHARGDSTGAEILDTLARAVRQAPEVRVVEEAFAADLLVEDGRAVGLFARHCDGRRVLHLAPAVVLATGGCGRLYLYSTNPREATGDGLAMAARAGARLVDLEFVQFHPTALATGEPGAEPLALLTEALRGEGAVLVDERGRRFMAAEHPDRELAPRDVVARAIWRRLAAGGRAWLDARAAVGKDFPRRFPTVFALCRARGLDPRREALPVTPAAHYHMGGIATDESGRTSLAGLWACGEVASTGVHGANRLASNSLLEALVFGGRVAADLRSAEGERLRSRRLVAPARLARLAARASRLAPAESSGPRGGGALVRRTRRAGRGRESERSLTLEVRTLLWEDVGLVRDAAGLVRAAARLDELAAEHPALGGEAGNLLGLGRLVTAAALARRESRGGHYRSDHPASDPAWHRRLFLTAAADGSARFESALAEPERRLMAADGG
jgi:L-aspartate oxidase